MSNINSLLNDLIESESWQKVLAYVIELEKLAEKNKELTEERNELIRNVQALEGAIRGELP